MSSKSSEGRRKSREEKLGDIGHELAMSLRRAYLTMHRATNACLAEYGLSADSFTVLTALSESGSLTQKALAQNIGSDPNTISAMLRRLEREKLIKRKRDAQDGRARLVHLTAKGRRLQERLWGKSQPLRIRMANLFLPEELRNFAASLKRFVQTIDGNND